MSRSDQAFIDLGEEVKVTVKFLKPGTILVFNTYDEEGNFAHSANTPFTEEKLNHLISSGIHTLYYSKSRDKSEFRVSEELNQYLNSGAYEGPRTITLESQKIGVSAMETIVKMIKQDSEIAFDGAKNFVEQIFHDIKHCKEELVNLLALEIYDDYTYTHSINTGIIAMLLAKEMGYDDNKVKDIGLGGFLHDIGKMKIPYQLLHKKDKLTLNEYDIIKKHSIYGFEIVKENSLLTDNVKDIILLHHEKFDGSGYPFRFKGKDINHEVHIVAIAECFDTLTTNHPYKQSISTSASLLTIMEAANSHFDPDIAKLFAQSMSHLLKENYFCPVDTYVLLNTQEIAKVVSLNQNFFFKPIIDIISKNNSIINPFLTIDLKSDANREIIRPLTKEENVQLENKINQN